MRDLGDEKGNEGNFTNSENLQNNRTCPKFFAEEMLARAGEDTQLRVCNSPKPRHEDGPHQFSRLAREDVDPQSRQSACRRTAEDPHGNGPHSDETSHSTDHCESTRKHWNGNKKQQLLHGGKCAGNKRFVNHSVHEGTPNCEDNHEPDDREVSDHEFGSHEDSQNQGGEAVRA